MADFTILLEFQEDFGDGLPDEDTRTMVKLEENYRSRENILQAANQLIEKNTQRIDKVLKPTRGLGEQIYVHKADDEVEEAQFVVNQIRRMEQQNPELDWGSFSILYRTNAQSRPFEDALRGKVPYIIVGGLKFYDRKEIKDSLAYLKAIANPDDTVSLLRIINTPRRGIGQATIDSLVGAAQELGVPLWEILSDKTSVSTLAGRSAKGVNSFAELIQRWQEQVENLSAAEIIQGIIEESGYIQDLKKQGTDEAENRLENISELYNAVLQFQEENEDTSLEGFLANASLASDLDNLQEGQKAVSLMTLHSAKGLEFPVVFLVGLEQGLFPNFRSIDDPASLEEERRLCYVGITRAQEQLYLSHARERRLYGNREAAVASQFLGELPKELVTSTLVKVKTNWQNQSSSEPKQQTSQRSTKQSQDWKVGELLIHDSFGTGEVTHVFGSGNKISIAVKFPGLGQKILDPKRTTLQRVR
jgi:DNA helicase-2/ATP-dependent DNA helicase PcrA